MLIVFNFAFLPAVHFQFNFRVDNKLLVGKGMGAQLCIWQEKHVVHIHLFDIIVLAGLLERLPSKFSVLNILVLIVSV